MNVAVEEVVSFFRDLLRKNKMNNVVLLYLHTSLVYNGGGFASFVTTSIIF